MRLSRGAIRHSLLRPFAHGRVSGGGFFTFLLVEVGGGEGHGCAPMFCVQRGSVPTLEPRPVAVPRLLALPPARLRAPQSVPARSPISVGQYRVQRVGRSSLLVTELRPQSLAYLCAGRHPWPGYQTTCLSEPGGWLSGSDRPLRWPTVRFSGRLSDPTRLRSAPPSARGIGGARG
jgi:hypothetical protein